MLGNSSSLTEIPKTFVGDAKFSSYFDACERAGFTKDEELQYVKDMMTKNDIVNSKREACEKAEAKGRSEGHAAGMSEGAAESKREVAGKMKERGAEVKFIAECTGLTIAEIEAL